MTTNTKPMSKAEMVRLALSNLSGLDSLQGKEKVAKVNEFIRTSSQIPESDKRSVSLSDLNNVVRSQNSKPQFTMDDIEQFFVISRKGGVKSLEKYAEELNTAIGTLSESSPVRPVLESNLAQTEATIAEYQQVEQLVSRVLELSK